MQSSNNFAYFLKHLCTAICLSLWVSHSITPVFWGLPMSSRGSKHCTAVDRLPWYPTSLYSVAIKDFETVKSILSTCFLLLKTTTKPLFENTNSSAGNDLTKHRVPNWQQSIRKSQTGSLFKKNAMLPTSQCKMSNTLTEKKTPNLISLQLFYNEAK